MTREEIIALAQEAGFWREHVNTWMCNSEDIEDFAALVAAAERERCAKVCEQIDTAAFGSERPAPNDCAAAVRELK